MKKILTILIVLVGCLFLVSCSTNSQSNEERDSSPTDEINEPEENLEHEENESQKETNTQQNEPEYHSSYPLTGVGTNESITDRPVSVMVNNHPKARPQSGLAKADLIFEFLTEGSITRFLAIYQSEHPEKVGPVRSAREYFFELAQGYQAMYIYHGAARSVNDLIIQQGIDYLSGSVHDDDGYLFKRESFRKAPHNSYLLFDAVYDEAKSKNYDIIEEIEALPFVDNDVLVEGDEAKSFQIHYPGKRANDYIEYQYDEEQEIYTRYENQQQTVELATEEPIQIDNVFIIETDHQFEGKTSGRREIDLQTGGNGYLLQKGVRQKVKWINDEGRLLPYKNGEPVGFTPGKTWTNIVPINPGLETAVTILDGGT